MGMSNIIALAALVVSVVTAGVAWRNSRATERMADVSGYFHWLPSKASVLLPSGDTIYVGYHLVLANRGPHRAEQVDLKVYLRRRGSDRQEVVLADLESNELPLEVLDRGGRYPIPWALGNGLEFLDERRFEVELTWMDGNGSHKRRIPLRRGNIGIVP